MKVRKRSNSVTSSASTADSDGNDHKTLPTTANLPSTSDSGSELIECDIVILGGINIIFATVVKTTVKFFTKPNNLRDTSTFAMIVNCIGWAFYGRVLQASMTDIGLVVLVELVMVIQEVVEMKFYSDGQTLTSYVYGLLAGKSSKTDEGFDARRHSLQGMNTSRHANAMLVPIIQMMETTCTITAAVFVLSCNFSPTVAQVMNPQLVLVNSIISFVGETIISDAVVTYIHGVKKMDYPHNYIYLWFLSRTKRFVGLWICAVPLVLVNVMLPTAWLTCSYMDSAGLVSITSCYQLGAESA